MDIWLWATLLVFIAIAVVLISTWVLTVHGLQIISPRQSGSCAVYNICLNIRINGHPVVATLDTGTDFTLIPSSYASSLGLNNLPTSSIIGRDMPFSGIGGGSQMLHSVNVLMNIEKSRPFYVGVLLNQGDQPPVILLSLHDLYQAYRLQFVPLR